MKRRHMIAVAICAVMLLSMVVSSAYIAREAAHHHDCVGKDCPICQAIDRIRQLRRSIGAILLAALSGRLALATRREWGACGRAGAPALCTPVGWKIRLND